jgi:hypothetical protein
MENFCNLITSLSVILYKGNYGQPVQAERMSRYMPRLQFNRRINS